MRTKGKMNALPSGTKRCSKCGEVKPLEEFSPNKELRDGRSSHCKVCHRSYKDDPKRKREQYYRVRDNPEFKAKRRAKWREYAERTKERRAEYRRAYYAMNKDHIKAKCRERYKKHKSKIKARNLAWRVRNPDKCRELYRRYRASGKYILSDSYIKRCLKSTGIPTPTAEQIEQKRLMLKLKRKIYEIQRSISYTR